MAEWVTKSPKAGGFIKKILSVLSGVSGKMSEGVKYLSVKMPKLSKWISTLTSGVSKALTWIGETLTKLISIPGKTAEKIGNAIQGNRLAGKTIGKGLKSTTNLGMVMGGLHMTTNQLSANSAKKMSQIIPDDLLHKSVDSGLNDLVLQLQANK